MKYISIHKLFVPGTIKSVLGLGVTTTIGYGTLYYSFTIMSAEFQNEFAWSKSFIFGIFSLGIFLGGLSAPIVGKMLDKHGARAIMSLGSLLVFLGLIGISLVQNEWHYIIAILFLEIFSTLVLYEAAFVAFSQLAGSKARTPITQITLIAGFASTIFWPLITFLLSIIDWRETYQFLALLHLLIALPIHFFLLDKKLKIDISKDDIKIINNSIELETKHKKEALVYITIIFSLIAIPITVTQTHFIGLLNGFGYELATAVAIGVFIGPSQVGARVAEMFFARYFSSLISGLFSIGIMCLGLCLLLFSGYSYTLALIYIVFYAIGQGLSDIIRGSIPLYLFGTHGYGLTIGKINFFRTFMIASVPFGFAYILDTWGSFIGATILVSVTLIAFVMLLILQLKIKRWG